VKSKLSRSKLALTTAAISLLATANIVHAKPSLIFRAILPQVKNQLPFGMPFRLPSNISFVSYEGIRVPLYSQIDGRLCSKGICSVTLSDHQKCQAHACFMGSISVSSANLKDSYINTLQFESTFPLSSLRKIREIKRRKDYTLWSDAEKRLMISAEGAILNRAPITLKAGVRGFFIVENGAGVSTPASGTVLWNQDGYTYRLYQRTSLTENWQISQDQKDELIKAAISMAKEPAIISR
jgi:hypothetical protein